MIFDGNIFFRFFFWGGRWGELPPHLPRPSPTPMNRRSHLDNVWHVILDVFLSDSLLRPVPFGIKIISRPIGPRAARWYHTHL